MTQRELARRAHVTVTYVSRLESGAAAPGIDLVERLALALGVPLSQLLPSPSLPDTEEALRHQAKSQFDALLPKAGRESLLMVTLFMSRLLESASLGR